MLDLRFTQTVVVSEIQKLELELLQTGIVFLPGGHFPPTDPGGLRPKETPIPTVFSPNQAIRIQIPILDVDSSVVQGESWSHLKKGVGQKPGSVNPGEKGLLVLSAFDDIFGEIFRYLDHLNPGDEIIIFTNTNSFTYQYLRQNDG